MRNSLSQTPLTEIETTLNITQLAVLNPIAWALAKSVLQSVVKSTVSSVNKGPNGTPQFTTNLSATLQAVSDTQANSFISQLATNGAINSPYQTAVASAVGNNYLKSSGSNGFFNSNPFTLNQVSQNPTAFYSGAITQNGGLNAWESAWSNPANNPFGATELATNALGTQVTAAKQNQQAELNFGQGFASSRGKCTTTTTGGTTQKTTTGSTGSPVASLLTSLSPNSTCQSSPIQTPGSTIKASLDKALGSGVDTLVSAHTFDEIVTSILGQLINQAVSGPGGLAGTTQPSGASAGTTGTTPTAGSTYFDQTDPNQTTINSNLNTTFSNTIASQISSLQQFQTQWTTINGAAIAAKNALSTSTCYPNVSTTISGTVQPVINEAATSLAQAAAGITALQNIQNQVTAASQNSSNQASAMSNADTGIYKSCQSSFRRINTSKPI